MRYVVFLEKGDTLYLWTGQTANGRPIGAVEARAAKRFDRARAAYEDAGHHRELAWWRVGKRLR